MRLIDADVFNSFDYSTFDGRLSEDARQGIDLVLSLIANAPTVDAAPVVHGKWIEHYAFGCFHYDCSACDDGFATKNKQEKLPNYCANCGAKMDGGGEK